MKKIMTGNLTVIMTATMVGATPVSAAKTEVNDLAKIVAKAKSIQEGEWDSSLGPYDINGTTEYRYILSHDGNRNEVSFRLVEIGGLDSLATDLASVLK